MLEWWRERSRRQRAEAERRLDQHRAHIRREHERMAMERQKRDLFYGLGFDLSDDGQSWLRQAQLMKQFNDDIRDLRDRVSQLEGR